MPLLSIITSAELPAVPTRARLLAQLSALLARELDKPEAYVMVNLAPRAEMMTFGGSPAPACYAECKNVGTISAARAEELSAILCETLSAALGVPPDRIYIEFTSADGALWGWNGGTFG
jgi:phenylpyruvate tautomerase PptA (4-oxalocrotonate tautomerase family)